MVSEATRIIPLAIPSRDTAFFPGLYLLGHIRGILHGFERLPVEVRDRVLLRTPGIGGLGEQPVMLLLGQKLVDIEWGLATGGVGLRSANPTYGIGST